MAFIQIKSTLGTADPYGVPNSVDTNRPNSANAASGTLTADAVPVAAALAVLVADGAAPTQAHVTTLNNAYTTLAADIVAVAATVGGDVSVSIDKSKVGTLNKLKAALDAILQSARGSGDFTP